MCVSSVKNKGSCEFGPARINPTVTLGDNENFLEGKDEYRFQNPFNYKLQTGIKEVNFLKSLFN